MKRSIGKLCLSILPAVSSITILAGSVDAVEIAHYDLAPASGVSLAVTSTTAPFTATPLVLNNADNTDSAFGNHFYHNGWDTTLNVDKYYENTIGAGGNPFKFDSIGASFSLEETSGSASYTLRSSLDGFTGDIASGVFAGGLVTDFNVDLSGLGVITSDITFRWYMAGADRIGFANHEPGAEGEGSPDVGQDLRFFGSLHADSVPDGGATIAMLGLGVVGLAVARRRKA